MYVILQRPDNGELYLARGPVYSFYEFLQEGPPLSDQDWRGKKVLPAVTASFINYFGDGRDLVSIVGLLPEGMRISAHAWQGFGFQFLGESPLYPWIGDLHKGEHGIVADLDGQTQEFILSGHGPERHLLEWPLAEN